MKKVFLILILDLLGIQLFGQVSLAPFQGSNYNSGLILNLDARYYNGSGTTWNDLSNQNNKATLVGNPTYNSTAFFSFGSNKYATTTKSNISLKTATFVAWVKPSQNQADFTGIIFNRSSFGGSTSLATGINFFSNSVSYHWNDDAQTYNWNSGLTIPNNIWSMIAVSVNTNLATTYLYNVNNRLSASNNVTHTTLTGLNFYIGTDPGFSSNRSFIGNIGKVMIYDKALSQTEIQKIYDEQKNNYGLQKSCKEILNYYPQATSGVYLIDPDGNNSLPSTNCYCDMTTDGGGWTLVLNYLHKGGTNPNLYVFSNSLPILGSNNLGTDESSSTTTWGHTSNSYLNSFSFTELRFYGKTSGHSRVIHFKTSHANTIAYFKTGSGSMSGIKDSFSSLTGHTGNLPGSTTDFFTNQSNNAMTSFPFWNASNYHWGIGAGGRWEVDDYPNNSANNTYHQIWIR